MKYIIIIYVILSNNETIYKIETKIPITVQKEYELS